MIFIVDIDEPHEHILAMKTEAGNKLPLQLPVNPYSALFAKWF